MLKERKGMNRKEGINTTETYSRIPVNNTQQPGTRCFSQGASHKVLLIANSLAKNSITTPNC